MIRSRSVVAVLLFLVSALAFAQAYPNKPVRVVIPYAASGSGDVVARTVGAKLAEAWGQQVLIDNRPGAGGNIGTEYVAKQPADGYTLLLGSDIQMGINPHIFRKLPYDPEKDFLPIAPLTNNEFMLFVHPSVPANNLAELVALLKANPGKYSYGSAGVGSTHHLSMELFKLAAGFDAVHVPYKGFGQAMADTMSGQLQMSFATIALITPLLKAGKVRPIAIGAAQRVDAAPGVPTIAETYPGLEANASWNYFAPAGTPREIVMKINADANRILAMPEVRERLTSQGLFPVGGTPEKLAARMKADYEKWGKVVRAIDLKPE